MMMPLVLSQHFRSSARQRGILIHVSFLLQIEDGYRGSGEYNINPTQDPGLTNSGSGNKHPTGRALTSGWFIHPAGRALTSDWFIHPAGRALTSD